MYRSSSAKLKSRGDVTNDTVSSALPDLARETSKWGYENKPKTSDCSGHGKKKTKTLHTHINITLNP